MLDTHRERKVGTVLIVRHRERKVGTVLIVRHTEREGRDCLDC